jgi:DNA polymerase
VDHFFSSRKAAQNAGLELAESLGKFGSSYCLKQYEAEIMHLSAVLQELSPKVIIALGRTPLWALTGEGGLLQKVGSKLDCRLAKGIPVIPTYHPSFILRGNWGLQDAWLKHLQTAATQ